jgi:O-antigen ligase
VVPFAKRFRAEALPFWLLIAFIAFTFLTGGGSRADIQSLIILRPLAVIACGVALLRLRWEQVTAHRFLFGMAAAVFTLVGLHLIPLPPSLWSLLPGRGIIAEIDKVAGLGSVWRPLSMVPSATWNALYALFVPLAVLLLGVQIEREDRFRLLIAILGAGFATGLVGMLQVLGAGDGPLYFYNVTNNGLAVGLFANRNHQGIFLACLFPVLAVFACAGIKTEEQGRFRLGLAIAASVVLVPLLLVTGSRAGLILGVVGLLSVPLLYRKSELLRSKKAKVRRFNLPVVAGAVLVMALGALTMLMSRAEALQRLLASDKSDDRLLVWPYIAEIAWKYFPVGSGIGSFIEVYRIDEPYALLSPIYTNHAHNDWLELYMTAGLAGLALLAVVIFAFAKATHRAWRSAPAKSRETMFARLGSILLVMIALGSIGDYPLRTPSLACIWVIAALWLSPARRAR